MKNILNILLVISTFILIGCGGGSANGTNNLDNSGSDYTAQLKYVGKKDKAKLNDINSKEYVEALNTVFTNVLLGSLENSRQNRKLSKIIDSSSESGDISGYVSIKSEKVDDTNYINTLEYHNYSNDGVVTLNGKVVSKLEYNPYYGYFNLKKDFLEQLKITINKEFLILDGEISFPKGYSNRKETTTAVSNYIVKYKDKMLMYKDFIVNYKYGNPEKYSGRIYISEYGYVDITTPKSLKYDDYGKPLTGGELCIEGDSSKLQYKEAYNGKVRLDLDKNGDGTADEVHMFKDNNFEHEINNTAPIVKVLFPKEIFTNSKLKNSDIIKAYDPDLDDFNVSYEWSVNGVIKSTDDLDNSLFKKHDKVKLKVVATDSFGNSSSKTKEQEVINSRPVITMSKRDFKLGIGQKTPLGLSVVDADGDDLNISFESYESSMPGEDFIKFYYDNYNSCVNILKETYDDGDFSELTPYEQEDVINNNCPKDILGYKVDYEFIKDDNFNAIAGGDYLHKLVVNDGEYKRELVFQSHIKQIDLVEKTVNNHNGFKGTKATFGSVYIEDMDGDGKKDIVYSTYVKEKTDPMNEDEEDIESWVKGIAVEYRDGDKILKKVSKEINIYDTDINNFYVGDFNGDGRKDIVVNYYDTNSFDNRKFKIFLQENNGSFTDADLKLLDNARNVDVAKVFANSASIILNYYDIDASIFKTKIYSKENNITLTPISNKSEDINEDKKILTVDLDNNGKNDILLIDRSNEANNSIKLTIDIYYQQTDGSFEGQRVNKMLDNISTKDSIIDAVLDANKLYISTKKSIFIVDIIDEQITLEGRVNYTKDKSRHFMEMDKPIDINSDGLKDIIVYDKLSMKPVSIFIKKDADNYYPEEWYYPASSMEDNNIILQSSCRLNDIDNNGKYEVFINTGDEKLSEIYFK